jgi:hypothetical protein
MDKVKICDNQIRNCAVVFTLKPWGRFGYRSLERREGREVFLF